VLVGADAGETGVEGAGVTPAGEVPGAASVADGVAMAALAVVIGDAVRVVGTGVAIVAWSWPITKRRAPEVCASGFCTAIVICAAFWATMVA